MTNGPKSGLDFPRLTDAELNELRRYETATLHEAQGQTGAMASAIKPIFQGPAVFGTALTVRAKPGDNLAIHQAVANARRGDVLVVEYDSSDEYGPFGDILATASQMRGVVGLVIDGRVRDGRILQEMEFPVFARGLSMKATAKVHPGSVGAPIVCGGVAVNPGDVIAADADGVVVLARATLGDTLANARAREDKEEGMRARLKEGATTLELLGLRDIAEDAR